MLYRLLAVVIALAPTRPALAEPRAGTDGTITAWDRDQARVLGVTTCRRTRDGYDYATCERYVRWLMLKRLCARRGRGKHTFYLQLGDKPLTKTSVVCED